MGDISNKTLVGLLVVAIIVSLAGTMVSLHRLGKLSLPIFMMGQAAVQGTATVTIQGVAGISIPDSNISFGQGYVDPSATYAVLDSNKSSIADWENWVNTSAPPTLPDYFVIENSGTQIANVTAVLNQTNAETFICGANNGCPDTETAKVEIFAENNESGSCESGLQTTYVTIADSSGTTTQLLCSEWYYQYNRNSLKTYLRITVPYDVPSGAKTGYVKFVAEAV